MLQRNIFDKYKPGEDIYAKHSPELRLIGLPKKFIGTPEISILISTYNRSNQLARTLECLCRQTFNSIEILLCDDGSTENLALVLDKFDGFLNIHRYRIEKPTWHSCPSRAYKKMLPDVQGKIIVATHPEMMLHSTALDIIRQCLIGKYDNAHRYIVSIPAMENASEFCWTSLKPQFIQQQWKLIDTVDWHTDLNELKKLPDFMSTEGFAGRTNAWHSIQKEYPWWFVGAALNTFPMWNDLPTIDGHGIIDMWMMSYRMRNKIVDIVPSDVLCYHQPHQTAAIAPEGEQLSFELGRK